MSAITVNQQGTISTASTSESRTNSISDPLVAATNAAAQEAIANIESASRIAVATIGTTFQVTVANIEAAAAVSVENLRAGATTGAASINAAVSPVVAQINSDAQKAVANIEATNRIATTQISTSFQIQVAGIESAAAIQVETLRAGATTTSSTTQANATIQVATIDNSSKLSVATTAANAQIQAANAEANGRIQAATIDGLASNYKADRDLDGVKAHEAAELVRLNIKLAFADAKFEEVLPLVTGIVGSGTGTGSGGSSGFHGAARPGPIGFAPVVHASKSQSPRMSGTPETTAMGNEGYGFYSLTMRSTPMRMGSGDAKTGGIGFATGTTVADAVAGTQLPFISTSGVLTPAQVQQQVNAATARGDSRTQADIRKLIGDMAGRGFSSNSPILAALQVSLAGQNLKAGLAAETQIRLESTKLNADASFAGQKAVSDQFIQQEQVLLEGEKNTVTRQVGILNAVAQMVSSAL